MRRPYLNLVLAACVAMTAVLPACGGKDKQQRQNTTRTETNTTIQTASDLGDGLDLSRLPDLVKQAKNGEELEEILNTSGINNIDSNGDKEIDYLNVEELREGTSRGFLLFTNENNERMDWAQVEITQTQQNASVAVQGNPQYYGAQPAQYQSHFPLTELLILAWVMDMGRPRFYHSPYYKGRYPGYYSKYPHRSVMSKSMYRSKVGAGSFSIKGKPMVASASKRVPGSTTSSFARSNSAASSKRTMTGGNSFSTTGAKRPAGSLSNSTGFGSSSKRTVGAGSTSSTGTTRMGTDTSSLKSTTSKGSFGSSSNRKKPSFSFGGSSNRSGSSTSSGSSRRSSSFGGSSSRRRR